jgi:serine/threonine protein kinase
MFYQNWFITSLIGTGAFAKVYQVVRVEEVDGVLVEKFYAMKAIKKSKVADSAFLHSTMKERQLMLEMDHPFILKLHYAFQTPYTLYMVFDFVPGGDLFFHIKKKRHLCEKAAKFYGSQVILGLEYLHGKNIMYRDLKPENILID